jgi:short-subunit dehydrogenase
MEAMAQAIEGAGGLAGVYPCDVSDRDQVLEAAQRCEAELGPVQLLVANAGVSINTRVQAFDSEDVERVMGTNFLGAVYATEAVLPGMLERNSGQIVAVSSIAGFAGLPLSAAYSASKGAMTNFFESLRIDLRPTGVDVTVIAPGFVRTPMTDHNRHAMPFLMDRDPAVDLMVKAIEKRKKFLTFPWQLASVAWMARILPRAAYDRIASKVDRRKSPEAGRG